MVDGLREYVYAGQLYVFGRLIDVYESPGERFRITDGIDTLYISLARLISFINWDCVEVSDWRERELVQQQVWF